MRNKQIYKVALAAMLLVVLFSADLAIAQVTVPQVAGQAGNAFGAQQNNIRAIITRVLTILLMIAGFIAILFVIYGGFRYMTAGGNEDAAESGKKILFNAIIGLAIIILSWVILDVLQNAILGTV